MTALSRTIRPKGAPAVLPPGSAVLVESEGAASASPRQLAWRRFRRNRLAMLGITVIIFLAVIAVLAPIVALPLGMVAAMKRRNWQGVAASAVSQVGLSIPAIPSRSTPKRSANRPASRTCWGRISPVATC